MIKNRFGDQFYRLIAALFGLIFSIGFMVYLLQNPDEMGNSIYYHIPNGILGVLCLLSAGRRILELKIDFKSRVTFQIRNMNEFLSKLPLTMQNLGYSGKHEHQDVIAFEFLSRPRHRIEFFVEKPEGLVTMMGDKKSIRGLEPEIDKINI